MATKIDKLFALKAVEQKVTEERKLIEYECRDELLEAFEADGTDRRTSPYFGADAGKFSIKRMKGTPAKEVTEFNLTDDVEYAEWLESNASTLIAYAKLHHAEIAKYSVDNFGELPDGIAMVSYEEPGKEPYVTAQVYSFKPDIIIDKLGGNMLEGANRLLLGESDDR